MGPAIYLYRKVEQACSGALVGHAEVEYVRVGIVNGSCQAAKYASLVEHCYVKTCRQVPCRIAVPDNRDPAFRLFNLLTLSYGALRHVDDQAMTKAYPANNGIARKWTAARSQLYSLTFVAMNNNRRRSVGREFVNLSGCGGQHRIFWGETPGYNGCQALAQANIGKNFVARSGTGAFGQFFPGRIGFVREGNIKRLESLL